ncbi:MAG: Asp-tRNA(Asn)/Glu-tRNA(Gln) amidotransferase subunit GatC [Candidatus Nealsonbacteria bacterium]|nr:Asp-tRNA(Asn)/Glu-tRNA(Gln) amidotransferase subunit GatC [Candidatus Nealsonbacteria bacterium]
MISKKEVQHIAKLARLGLTEKEIEKFQRELSSILDYIEKLKEADVSGVELTDYSFDIGNIMREDLPAKIFKENLGRQAKKLLELAPETKNGYLKVKSIF